VTTAAHPVPPLVLSIAEAEVARGVSDDLVYRLVARGELPCVRFGRRRLIPRRAIEALRHRWRS